MLQICSRRTLLVCVIALLAGLAVSDSVVADTPRDVPVKLERQRVVIPTRVNGSDPLNLILDTGLGFDGVFLFNDRFLSQIDTSDAIEVQVPGAGAGEPTPALMIESGTLQFGDVTVENQRVVVSRGARTQGFGSDSVIGWNLFGHYAVEIDYDSSSIKLHDSDSLTPDSSWMVVPVEMRGTLPFFPVEVEVVPGEVRSLTVYIDLASAEALELLTFPDQKFSMPDSLSDSYLGTGLSGDIHGQTGVCHRVRLAGHDFLYVPTAFAPKAVRSKQGDADGVLGNESIRRFNVVFDYARSRLLFKANGQTAQGFR